MQSEGNREKHCHLTARDGSVRAIVAAPAAAGNTRRDQRLNESMQWVTDWHIREGGGPRGWAHLQPVEDAYTAQSYISTDSGNQESNLVMRCQIVDRYWRRKGC
jgi:hypothetical protein